MPDKAFEHVIPFRRAQTHSGETIWLPLVLVDLVQGSGSKTSLPLLFDTGASVTVLRRELHHLLGVPSWDSGPMVATETAGGSAPVPAYQYEATLEFLGKSVRCPVHLMELPPNPLYVGLFGRKLIFQEFGFGFWEGTRELYVTVTP
ncbi:MAG: retropepsin-like domain-containing protein [Deltaproteobacteria bacterium]|nr:retropepsin-like domain-containing protein [Deltaproteobacteria bacterium]